MLSMFKGKSGASGATMHWSMTRVVAFMFAVTVCYSLVLMARGGHAHDIGWPFCVVSIVTVLAVPLQGMFDYIQKYIVSAPGQKLARAVLEKAGLGGLGSTITSETKVTSTPGGTDASA